MVKALVSHAFQGPLDSIKFMDALHSLTSGRPPVTGWIQRIEALEGRDCSPRFLEMQRFVGNFFLKVGFGAKVCFRLNSRDLDDTRSRGGEFLVQNERALLGAMGYSSRNLLAFND